MAMNNLQKIYRSAVRAGGAQMDAMKYPRTFGNDNTLRRNVLRACANPRWGQAIEQGTFADNRVIESLHKLGELPSRIVLDVEHQLGRKLTRSRAIALTRAYETVMARKRHQATGNIIDFPAPLRLAA